MVFAADANDKLNMAIVGCGGRGGGNLGGVSSQNIVALCDTDDNITAEKGKEFPNAKRFADFRVMLDKMGNQIDAVVVSTPDHTHATAAAMAMRMGKHVYCEKPLTHTIHEARVLRDLARKHKLATQMGNQGTSASGMREAVEVIRAGALGQVYEMHVWSNRPVWPQGLPRPKDTGPGASESALGASGSARCPSGLTIRPTSRSTGADGWTSGLAPSAIWVATP